MELQKGKTYYIEGCAKEYQLENAIVANYIISRNYCLMIDGENVESVGLLISEDETTWYPENTLTDILSADL